MGDYGDVHYMCNRRGIGSREWLVEGNGGRSVDAFIEDFDCNLLQWVSDTGYVLYI